jgi:hypothetical protein
MPSDGRTEEFSEHAALMNQGIQVVKDVRNDICGHVLENAVQEALNDLAGSDVFGFLEIGLMMQHTYYKFAGELVVQILIRGVPEEDKHRVFMEKMQAIAGLFRSFALIESALNMYMAGRKLLLSDGGV